MVFFYLVTTGWISEISLCENSIDQSIKSIIAKLQSRQYLSESELQTLWTTLSDDPFKVFSRDRVVINRRGTFNML